MMGVHIQKKEAGVRNAEKSVKNKQSNQQPIKTGESYHSFSGFPIQNKLTIGSPNDKYEREADAMADRIMRMPQSFSSQPMSYGADTIQRKCAACEKEDEIQRKPLMMKSEGGTPMATPALGAQLSSSKGSGSPLPSVTNSFMSQAFGTDFSNVRVHTGARAVQMNQGLQARAFAHGSDIYFNRGQYNPGSSEGKRLLAHELTHTVQQGGVPGVQTTVNKISRFVKPSIQRTCATGITYDIGNHPAHVPACGSAPVATVTPAGIAGLVLSLEDGAATTVHSGSTISPAGAITIDSAQDAGEINVRAFTPAVPGVGGAPGTASCHFDMPLRIASHPTGITSTSTVGGPPTPATHYGGVFDHEFISNDGNVSSLENVGVGERFPNVPAPTAANHNNIPTPFGPFNLHTATLTPNATNNWFLTSAGGLGGTNDRVTWAKALVNVGDFMQSASNPTPTLALPSSFTLEQDLHWYCRSAVLASRWTQFIQINHIRGLRFNGTDLEIFTSVNGEERTEDYDGNPAFLNARATPNRVTHSTAGGTPNTVNITADTLPDPLASGHSLAFSIQGTAHGSTVNATTGVFSAGPTAATVTVRVRDSQTGNPNFDETTVTVV